MVRSGVDAVVVNREELAWAAGFFDGEGNTNTYDSRATGGRLGIQLAVTQIHRSTLERFQGILRAGRIYGPYFTKSGRHGQYTLKVRGFEQVQAAVAVLWPWLTPVKREQAALALVRYRSGWQPRRTITAEQRRSYKSEWARLSRARGGVRV